MKKTKKYSRPTVVLLALAILLLTVGGIWSALAALTYSRSYYSQFATQNIDLVLNENGAAIESGGELLSGLLGEEPSFKIGKSYEEALSVTNTGDIDQYVRVTIDKYWQTSEGKRVDLDPALIKLTFGTAGWIVEEKANERTVLYYTEVLAPGETTSDALTALLVDPKLEQLVTQKRSPESGFPATITTTYKYGDVEFGITVNVDGVQTHNAEDAMLSAWGVKATLSGETITAVE